MIRNFFLCLCLFISSTLFGQIGGKHAFEFLNIPGNARLSALGGVNASRGGDINFFQSNPSLLTDSMDNNASLSYRIMPADIGLMNLSYAIDFKGAGIFSIGIHHVDYGTIHGYDAAGTETGNFNAGETAIFIGKVHKIRHFRIGANIKTVFSNVAGYRSSAIITDLGGAFEHPSGRLMVGLVIKNLGIILSDYTETSASTLPFDVQAGVTVKPEHMPLRFSFTAHNLTQPDITYHDPGSSVKAPRTLDKVLRHFNLAAEILIHRNFNVLAGYNFLVHQDLKLETTGGGAGFTVGIAVRVKSFELILSRGTYVVGNAGYAFTLTSDFNRLLKRR